MPVPPIRATATLNAITRFTPHPDLIPLITRDLQSRRETKNVIANLGNMFQPISMSLQRNISHNRHSKSGESSAIVTSPF
ncbi:hypothetical protein PUN28_005412 [Cardiocondyla obscurior]|uniref:Uncharacterized protein n=1 Tax=Cardiocondyla obscurior TaxID=286306 RepID=A0AAW2GJ01_9HYME